MTDRNKQLALIFHNLASIYKFLGENNAFRAIAYDRASQSIKGLPEDISYYIAEETVKDIPGVGESLEEDIREFYENGTVKRYEKLKQRVPEGILDLMNISGFGPQSLKTLYMLKLKLN